MKYKYRISNPAIIPGTQTFFIKEPLPDLEHTLSSQSSASHSMLVIMKFQTLQQFETNGCPAPLPPVRR